MTNVRRLLYTDIAPGLPFHAARVTLGAGPRELHRHDFGEMFLVLDGEGRHEVNDASVPLQRGSLVLIRPPDRHCFVVSAGRHLRFINIAYPVDAWRGFLEFAAVPDAARWTSSTLPPVARVTDREGEHTARAFTDAMSAFQGRPTRLALGRFWAETLPSLVGGPPPAAESPEPPPWLRGVLAEMQDDDLRAGFDCLLERSGVSAAHLARTMRRHTGQTPTAWINARRVTLAAQRLATTEDDIYEIAMDCGFENLSYFYRVFGRRYGLPPRAFRTQARRSVVP
jgi:AraC family cel operon transcriptional repressor